MSDQPQPRPRAPRLSPDQRRSQLLQHAIEQCAKHGISHARPVDVAKAAGVSESTVFVYFKTRAELIQAVLGEVDQFYMRNNRKYLIGFAGSVPQAILSLGAAFSAAVETHPNHAQVWLSWSQHLGDQTFSLYSKYQEVVVRLVADLLRRGQADQSVADDIVPEDSARMLYMAAQMVVQMQLTGKPAREVDRFLISATRAVIGRHLRIDDIPRQLLDVFHSDTKRIFNLVS
jgi:TetR/AcrR family hemagglutinin/protease transcriptional regulator